MIVKLIEENNNIITLKPAGDSDKASGDKYKILEDNKKSIDGETVYRIQALKDFTCQGREVAKGDFGGYVASEDNLSQSGTCWIFDKAAVCDSSVVKDDAKVAGFATLICGGSRIENSAVIESGTIDHCNIKDKDSSYITLCDYLFCDSKVIKESDLLKYIDSSLKDCLIKEDIYDKVV